MESGHRFDAQTLHSFIQAVFRQMGSEEQEAKLVADHLIAANLAGHDSHGIGMIPSYVRSWSQGHLQINHHAKIVKEAGAVVTLDGDRAFGQVAAHEAMALGIEKAHQHGIAAVALHNSHHIGRIGYWAEQCAAQGLISIHFVSVVGDPMVAPFRGKAWSVFQWSRRSTVATAALAPIPSVWFSLVKISSRCCLITPPAPLHLAKPASPGIKASPCRQVA